MNTGIIQHLIEYITVSVNNVSITLKVFAFNFQSSFFHARLLFPAEYISRFLAGICPPLFVAGPPN